MDYRVGHICDDCKDAILPKCEFCGRTDMVTNGLCSICKFGDDMNNDLQELINRKNIVKNGDCCTCKNIAKEIRTVMQRLNNNEDKN